MAAAQRELGLLVVIEATLFPIIAAVAVGAGITVTTFVLIVFAVTGGAIATGIPILFGIGMATAARGDFVFSGQRELGARMIEAATGLPGLRGVAALAGTTQRTGVAVVIAMAAATGAWCRFETGRTFVAAGALDSDVLSDQRKASGLVIESGITPVRVAMTLGTILTERSAMLVVLAMATDTRQLQSLLAITLAMAVFALDFGVVAGEFELGAAVIKVRDRPAITVVTFGAVAAEPVGVDVVLAMTASAARRGLPILIAGLVTVRAFRLQVLAAQRKIGLRMVEGVDVEHDDPGVAALVLGMATTALRCNFFAVKATMIADIISNLFVTGQAHAWLRGLVKRDMTLVAVVFDFGVRLYHRPRHDQTLQPGRRVCRRRTAERVEDHEGHE
jgi:hypothetical protein